MSGDLTDHQIHDLIGVGLGPFGLALAALATAGLTTEEELLRVLRDELRAHCLRPRPSTAAELLLEAPTLPVKANLLTGVDGRDELDGDVAVQSVYVDVPNPLLEVSS